ncbi:MAG TPA: hypothetical protein VFT78_05045 [Hanamia sp.]|jgi:hypothetical protein|nr:hypothetical protein [Hanamia sp.]
MNRFATLMIFKNNCSTVAVNIFKSVRDVSKADTSCINSEQYNLMKVFIQLEKQ